MIKWNLIRQKIVDVILNLHHWYWRLSVIPALKMVKILSWPKPKRISFWSSFLLTGQQIYERIRELSFQDADIFIICFSIDDQLTFNNVGKWYYEARQHDKTVPILLVGAKRDMREVGIDSESCVKYSDAVATANMIGAAGYVECSALTNDGVKKVFDDALQMVLFPWSKLPVESTACNILWPKWD